MKHRSHFLRHLTLLASLTLISSVCFSQEAVNLTGEPEPKPGRTWREVTEAVMKDGTMNMAMGDQQMNGTCDSTESTIATAEELKDGKVRLIIEKEVSSNSITLGGRTQSNDEQGPLVGIPLIAEKTNGKWTFRLEKGQPTPEQQEELDGLADDKAIDAEIYPDRKIKVGESWSMSPKAIAHLMGEDTPNASGKGTLTLKDIVEHNGQRCALIELDFEGSGTMTDDSGVAVQMTMAMKGDIYRSLEMFEDIKADLKGNIDMTSSPQEGFSMKMGGPLTLTSSITYE